jgi:crotonobetainyl-CoA:carnitine CoA-transferase CaiB-like acyl-CoA transferase
MLADYGADVIKVEGPSRPDGERDNIPRAGKGSSYRFGMLNRNKRAIAINLKLDAGREALLRVLDTADVVLEGFRPGTMDRLGVGYAAVSARNPRVVYCSLSGYGQDGPYAALPGHDLNYLAATGITSYLAEETGLPDEPLRPPRIPLADIGGGSLMAVFGILAALVARETTGAGDYIDVSMFDGAFFWQSARAHVYLAEGREQPGTALPTTGANPGYAIYTAGDGRRLSLGCLEPVFWRNLRTALGLEADLPVEQPAAESARAARHLIAERLREHDRQTWLEIMRRHDVPAAPVLTTAEALEDPHLQARQLIQNTDLGDGVGKHIGFPVKFLRSRPSLRNAAPEFGEHTDDLLREVGYADKEVADLHAAGAVA